MTKEQGLAILTRVGFVGRGLMYIAIGALVIFLRRAEGTGGALQFLGAGIGRWFLVVIAAGFAGYGLWRLADAALGTEHPGDGKRPMAKRAGSAVSGVVHLFLCYETAKLAAGAARASSGADGTAESLLHLPGGRLLLAAVAAGFALAALAQLAKSIRCDFLDHLVPQARESAVKWIGRLGYLARAGVFAIVAYYFLLAALDGASWKAGGTEQVFAWLSRPLSRGLAAGLILFGLYSLIEAWYRRIRTPDIDGVAARAREKLAPG